MTKLIDNHGRPLGDIDILKLRVQARQYVQPGQGYVVSSSDGVGITGMVPHERTLQPLQFTASQWRIAP